MRTQGINLAKYPAGGYEIEIADVLAGKFGLTHKNDKAEEIRQIREERQRALDERQRALDERQRALDERLKNVAATAAPATGATVNSLLLRAEQEAETGDFAKAEAYYNKVLDTDPTNSKAWLGLFFCENKTTDDIGIKIWDNPKNLAECDSFFDRNNYIETTLKGKNFRNAVKYADKDTRKEYEKIAQEVLESISQAQTVLNTERKKLAAAELLDKGFKIKGKVLVKYVGCDSLVKIPDFIEKIGSNAFRDSQNVQCVHIPVSVKIIESFAFASYNMDNRSISGVHEVIFDHNSRLQKIGDDAFKYSQITSIKLPENVEYIGRGAFSWTNLNSITIPAKVKYLGDSAFEYNRSLKELKINSFIPELGKSILKNCDKLERVIMPKSMKSQKGNFVSSVGQILGRFLDGTKVEFIYF